MCECVLVVCFHCKISQKTQTRVERSGGRKRDKIVRTIGGRKGREGLKCKKEKGEENR